MLIAAYYASNTDVCALKPRLSPPLALVPTAHILGFSISSCSFSDCLISDGSSIGFLSTLFSLPFSVAVDLYFYYSFTIILKMIINQRGDYSVLLSQKPIICFEKCLNRDMIRDL